MKKLTKIKVFFPFFGGSRISTAIDVLLCVVLSMTGKSLLSTCVVIYLCINLLFVSARREKGKKAQVRKAKTNQMVSFFILNKRPIDSTRWTKTNFFLAQCLMLRYISLARVMMNLNELVCYQNLCSRTFLCLHTCRRPIIK